MCCTLIDGNSVAVVANGVSLMRTLHVCFAISLFSSSALLIWTGRGGWEKLEVGITALCAFIRLLRRVTCVKESSSWDPTEKLRGSGLEVLELARLA